PTPAPTQAAAAVDTTPGDTGFIAPDGDGGAPKPGWQAPLTFHADPRTGTAGASLRGEVAVPDPTAEDSYTGLKVDLDLEGDGAENKGRARVYVQEADGSNSLDSGEIEYDTASLID
ncbi:MAG TPA: hypothetical protein VM840_12875, partial [Actinomycetota bacterium]|nr:hypothetical protein [Actinomycetota bacterium]